MPVGAVISRARVDDDLAPGLAIAQHCEGVGCFRERQWLAEDQWVDAALVVQLDEFGERSGHGRRLARHRGSPMHADDAVVLEQDVVRGCLGNPTTRETDDQITTVPADHAPRLIEHVAANRVVHDVHAVVVGGFADRLDEIFGVVVDYHFGAEFLADLHLLRTAGGGEDPGAGRQTQLYRRRSDPAGTGVNEKRLTRLDLSAIV